MYIKATSLLCYCAMLQTTFITLVLHNVYSIYVFMFDAFLDAPCFKCIVGVIEIRLNVII